MFPFGSFWQSNQNKPASFATHQHARADAVQWDVLSRDSNKKEDLPVGGEPDTRPLCPRWWDDLTQPQARVVNLRAILRLDIDPFMCVTLNAESVLLNDKWQIGFQKQILSFDWICRAS